MSAYIFATQQPNKIPDVIWPRTEGSLGKICQKAAPEHEKYLQEIKNTGIYTNIKLHKMVWIDSQQAARDPSFQVSVQEQASRALWPASV